MKALRKFRDLIKHLEVPLFFAAAILGGYLAIATALRGAKVPDEATWAPWTIWFLLMLVAAVFVPLYAFYKALDAYFQTVDKAKAETEEAESKLQRDLELMCQRTVAAIAERCEKVTVNDLCAQVWLCRKDGAFDRRALFFLPDNARHGSGMTWKKGKGIAGVVWVSEESLSAELGPLADQLKELGDARFNELDPSQRYGMTAAEIRKTARYTGIYAIPLFSMENSPRLLAVFVIDYLGKEGFDCVEREASKRPVENYLAATEKILTEAKGILPI